METIETNLTKDKTNLIKYQEFFICKDNIIYKISLEKNLDEISITSGNYYKKFNLHELSVQFQINFFSLDNAYNYIIDLFEDNKVNIDSKTKYQTIIIKIYLPNNISSEIKLEYDDKHQNNLISDNIMQLKNEIKTLKDKNDKLEKEIITMKQNMSNKNQAPKNIKLMYTIEEHSYADYGLDNTFAVFNSFNDILYLVYSTKKKSIICHDIKNHILISELKYCHNGYITSIKHFTDKNNKIDIIMSIANEENNIKLWNIRDMTCILNLTNINKEGFLYSACFLCFNSQNFIVSSNYDEFGHSEKLKVFDFKGEKVKEIKKSNEPTFYIESYFDNIFDCQYYIVTGNLNYVKSYNYNKNEIYHKYFDNSINGYHYSIIIHNENAVVKLIESCEDGNIRIWHFHSGILLKKIRVCKDNINGICLYNDRYIFVGSDEQNIKIVDLDEGCVIKKLHAHSREVLNIQMISHPKYGHILISQAYVEDQIRIWSIDN